MSAKQVRISGQEEGRELLKRDGRKDEKSSSASVWVK